jgi:hypothetical protein
MISSIHLSLCFAAAVLLSACGRSPKGEPTASADADAGPAPVAVASAAPVATAPAVAEEPAGSDTGEVVGEGTPDAGVRKRRAHSARTQDAGAGSVVAAEAPAAPPAPPPPVAPPVAPARKASAMGDDRPYGGPSVASSAVLEKKKLPVDDPWGNASR